MKRWSQLGWSSFLVLIMFTAPIFCSTAHGWSVAIVNNSNHSCSVSVTVNKVVTGGIACDYNVTAKKAVTCDTNLWCPYSYSVKCGHNGPSRTTTSTENLLMTFHTRCWNTTITIPEKGAPVWQ